MKHNVHRIDCTLFVLPFRLRFAELSEEQLKRRHVYANCGRFIASQLLGHVYWVTFIGSRLLGHVARHVAFL